MIYFVDFEASSLLPGSFPIEVAWVDHHGQGESYLIRPCDEWLENDYGWSRESEAIHGISRDVLLRNGVPLERVARRAADVLSSRRVMAFSDAPGYDGQWLEILLNEAGERRSVELLDVLQAYGFACRPLLDILAPLEGKEREEAQERVRSLGLRIVAKAQDAERMRPRVVHRALPDAESLWRTWRTVREEVARHVAGERGR